MFGSSDESGPGGEFLTNLEGGGANEGLSEYGIPRWAGGAARQEGERESSE